MILPLFFIVFKQTKKTTIHLCRQCVTNDIFFSFYAAAAGSAITGGSFNTFAAIKTQAIGPGEREYHATAAIGSTLFLFGGRDARGTLLGDLWAFDPATRLWTLVANASAPQARMGHGLAAVTMSGGQPCLFLHGGLGSLGPLDDSWCFFPDNKTWLPLPAGPSARYMHACQATATGATVYVFGGLASDQGPGLQLNLLADLWSFDLPTLRYLSIHRHF